MNKINIKMMVAQFSNIHMFRHNPYKISTKLRDSLTFYLSGDSRWMGASEVSNIIEREFRI